MTAGSEKYIGKLVALSAEELLTAPFPYKMEHTLKLTVMDIPIRGPHGETGFQHLVQCAPMDNGMHPATLYVSPTAIRYFRDMHEDDRVGHENLVKGTLESLEQARARAAGIQIPSLIVPPNVRS